MVQVTVVSVVSPVRPTLVRECLSAAVGGWGGVVVGALFPYYTHSGEGGY